MIGQIVAQAVQRLLSRRIEAPQREARLLLAAATGRSQNEIMAWPERHLSSTEQSAFDRFLDRRIAHEPLSRIIGKRGFWTLDLEIGPATLDPRADTETIVEAALTYLDRTRRDLRIIDFGTGTGAILLALLSELPDAWGIGVDLSPEAARVAIGNARLVRLDNRCAFVVGDWASMLRNLRLPPFDLIVSNPPYIVSAEIATLDPCVRDYDPLLALDGGADGLHAYRQLIPAIAPLLAADGVAVLEIGQGQAQPVTDIATDHGLALIEARPDLAGIIRALVFQNRSACRK